MTSRLLVSLALLTLSLACAEMRQNLRGQELSYRGAWFCESERCKDSELVISRSGTREGTTDITTVSLDSKAALAFTAAAAFETLTATVRDCKGKSAEVPAASILAAGSHGVGDASARESWIVFIDRSQLESLELAKSGKCARWMIDAKATWTDGATYGMSVGLDVK